MSQTGSEMVGEELLAAGVTTMFGVMGEVSIDTVAHLVGHGARYIPVRHEAGAVSMADGYARASGRVGVASVTYGPGLTNTLTALASAVRHQGRVLLLTGQRSNIDTPQGIDQPAIVAPTRAYLHAVDTAEDVPGSVERAIAEMDRRGTPVVLNYRDKVVEGHHDGGAVRAAAARRPPAAEPPPAPIPQPEPDSIARVLALIRAAERPIIVAGRGAVAAQGILEALAEAVNAALLTTLLAKGLFASHPRLVGLSGGFASETGRQVMAEADLVLAFGAGLNVWTTRLGEAYPNARILQVDADPAAFGRAAVRASETICGDAEAVADRLVAELAAGAGFPREPWWTAVPQPLSTEAGVFRQGGAHPRELCRVLNDILPADRTIVIDAGHNFEFPATEMTAPDSRGFLWTAGFGSIGLGLATAIGAAVGNPDRLTVLFAGDGGFMMGLPEIETAVRCRVPLLIFLLNDNAYGAEIRHLEARNLPFALAEFDNPDFVAVAESFGARGLRLHSPDDFPAVRAAIKAGIDRPVLVEVRIDGSVAGEYVEILHELVRREYG